ncbi:MAG: M28 family peptidase [Ginsengibacter sp.]
MKHVFLALFAAFIFTASSFAQDDAIKYAKAITEANLLKQLKIVASADMEGRETGTPGIRMAASYIESQFKEFGLKFSPKINGYQQFYPLHQNNLTPESFKIGHHQLVFGKDYMVQVGSIEKTKIKSASLEFVGYGINEKNYNDYEGKNLNGKIAVMISGEPKSGNVFLVSGTERPSRWGFSTPMKAQAAKDKGAIAVIIINTSWDVVPSRIAEASLNTGVYFPRPDGKITIATLTKNQLQNIFSEKDAAAITNAYTAHKELNSLKVSTNKTADLSLHLNTNVIGATNVLGYIEGTDKKDEYVFISAHYDHLGKKGDVIYYGADDDGSGTVALIEMARAFSLAKKEGKGPRRTIVFLAFSGEEKGLWGSEYYSENPVFPLEKTTVDLNIDMIGRLDPGRKYGDSTNYIYIVGDDKLSSDLKPITIAANNKLTKLELDYKFNDPNDKERIYFRSDHYNFARKGVPVIFYFNGMHADYHKPTDTWDKINYDVMEKRARLVFMTAWEMANRNEMLVRDIPLPAETR